METVSEWQPITTAPAVAELELSILDRGEYHRLAFPSRRDGLTWRDGRTNRIFVLSRRIGGCGIARTFDKRGLKFWHLYRSTLQFCSMSAAGLGWVKTPKLKFQIESSSRLRLFEKQNR